MQFFNFWNPQTFHYFKWLTEGGAVDCAALVAKAMERVEGDSWFEMGVCVSRVVRDKLAEDLEELLDEEILSEVMPLDEPEIGMVNSRPESLWAPILDAAVRDICFHSVAEAVLIKQGKWAPDQDLPEIE